jgi:hypothetical protein
LICLVASNPFKTGISRSINMIHTPLQLTLQILFLRDFTFFTHISPFAASVIFNLSVTPTHIIPFSVCQLYSMSSTIITSGQQSPLKKRMEDDTVSSSIFLFEFILSNIIFVSSFSIISFSDSRDSRASSPCGRAILLVSSILLVPSS